MNKFTADFHKGKFPGFKVNCSYQEVIDNFWFSDQIPFVETDFDFDVKEAHNWLVEHDYLFETQFTQINRKNFALENGYEWFMDADSNNWSLLSVMGEDPAIGNLVAGGEEQVQKHQPMLFADAMPGFKEQLDKNQLPVTRIKIFRLGPGGWAQPHVDLKMPGYAINTHIWMPLHDFAPSLKVYPYGYVQHRTGRAYILNNNNYVHSVINTDDVPRYAAIMKIDYKNLPENSWNRIKQSLKTQWFD